MAANNQLENLVVKLVEKEIDKEIDRLDNMDDNELEFLRQKRLGEMKRKHEEKLKWLGEGRGLLSTLNGESEFFELGKSNDRLVLFFYKDKQSSETEIVLKTLMNIAKAHLETKFVMADLNKSTFLGKRLELNDQPGIISVLNTKIYGPLKCDLSSQEKAKLLAEKLEQKLEMVGAIDPDVERKEREMVAKNIKEKAAGKKTIRDMSREFPSSLYSE